VSGIVASGSAAYGASKGGIRQLSKSIAKYYATQNIRCNTICPGPTDTAAIRAFNPSPGALAGRVDTVPMGRMATPMEIAQAVVFLASDESSFMTGTELIVDGGVTAV
jgi:NAD(P)-dependent dehydrogenase (short-subunit alcohol dehydrogenase family)